MSPQRKRTDIDIQVEEKEEEPEVVNPVSSFIEKLVEQEKTQNAGFSKTMKAKTGKSL